MKNDKNLGTRVYETIDWVGHRLPPALLRTVSLPLSYQSNTTDVFAYESARMINIALSIVKNNQVEGDYAEFGVFQGKTFIEAYEGARRLELSKLKFWAFDSFAGLPEVKNVDVGGEFTAGQFAFSKQSFIENLEKYRVDIERVGIVEGFYDDTLTSGGRDNLPKSIAVAWIDCDLYESTVPVLEFLTHRLVDGSVLIFDDWFCFKARPDKGEQRACTEWLKANPEIQLTEYHKFHWAGNSFNFNRS